MPELTLTFLKECQVMPHEPESMLPSMVARKRRSAEALEVRAAQKRSEARELQARWDAFVAKREAAKQQQASA